MFDKIEFDQKTREEFQKQINELQDFLANAIKVNDNIRDLDIYQLPDEKFLKYIAEADIPSTPRDSKQVLDELVENVYTKAMLIQHPRFFSFVGSAVSPYSLAASILSDIYNLHGGSYDIAPGACVIEEKLCKWMGSLAGYPVETSGGIFTSGASISTLSALICARDAKLKEEEFTNGVAYFSDQTHSSVIKGLRLLGIRDRQIRKIPTDDNFKIRLDLLEQQINEDIKKGFKPYLVVGNLGTTNTGTIDPLDKIGDIAYKYNLWFHIDGAFGGSILLSPIYKNLAKGIEKSDSLSWDSHKWLMQTYSSSTLLVKDKQNMLNSFTEHPEYLEDVSSSEHNDGWDLGPEMTRPHRALKLWTTIQCMGTDLLAELIEYSFYNAKLAQKELNKYSSWEILSEPMCGTINFRYHPINVDENKLDDLNALISENIISDGYTFCVTTRIKNKKTLRLCLINANTTDEDIITSIKRINEIAVKTTKKFI